MTRLWMLDTNTISYIVRGKSSAARAKLYRLQGDEVGCMSAITEAALDAAGTGAYEWTK